MRYLIIVIVLVHLKFTSCNNIEDECKEPLIMAPCMELEYSEMKRMGFKDTAYESVRALFKQNVGYSTICYWDKNDEIDRVLWVIHIDSIDSLNVAKAISSYGSVDWKSFVERGSGGFKIHNPNMDTFDCIPFNNELMIFKDYSAP